MGDCPGKQDVAGSYRPPNPKGLEGVLLKVARLVHGKGQAGALPNYGNEAVTATAAAQLNIRPYGQAVKTLPFHGSNPGSSPGRVTRLETPRKGRFCEELLDFRR